MAERWRAGAAGLPFGVLRGYVGTSLAEHTPRVNGVVLPAWVIDSVAVVPGGAHPSYAHDYSERDNAAYAAWNPIGRDPRAFDDWLGGLTGGAVREGGAVS